MTTTPRLWNSLTQVNTTDDDHTQFQGEITARQDGGYIVVWTDTSADLQFPRRSDRRPALRCRGQQGRRRSGPRRRG